MMIKLKAILSVLMVGLFGILCAQPTASESEFIKVDQFGYLPNSTKVGVISNPQIGYNAGQSFSPGSTYQLREWQSGNVVLSGSPEAWNGGATHDQSGDQGWWFDFSSVNAPGTYYIYDAGNNVRSPGFDIGETVYNEVLKAAGRMFYYNRCNTPKSAPYAEGGWTDGTSFSNNLQDGNSRYIFDQNNAASEKDLSGGWYDAGDFNKYVTFADPAMHNLMAAYESNPDVFTDNWNIPESGNGIPDILDEIKWELEWLLKMNNADGSTHIKMGSKNYSENTSVPPSANTDPRYYGPTCTSAAISVAGVFAQAAKIYGDFPAMNAFTQELQNSAVNTWNYVLPLINSNQFETTCDNGEIISGDADWDVATQKEKALKAAIHLFDLSGNNTYNQYIISHLSDAEQIALTYWAPYKMPLNDALLLYTTLNGADASAVSTIISSATNDAAGNGSGFYGFSNTDLYRAYIPDWAYHWGSSIPKAGTGIMNHALLQYGLNPGSDAPYQQRTQEVIHYFHGVNPLGITHLTNMYDYGAERCANEMYHQWFRDGTVWDNALTSTYGPAPGYIVGGANKDFSIPTMMPPAGQPAQKSYLDFNTDFPENSWEISEPSITYQAFYLRALAAVMPANACPPAGTACNDGDPNTDNDVENGFCECSGTPPVSACELLTNSGFDNDAESWVYWNCAVESIGGIVNITAINPGANPWDVGFSQNETGIIIEQAETYEIVFRARADANRTLDIKVGAILTPFTTYHYETINLTTTMQVYTLTFPMSSPTDNNASFDFYMGGNSTSVYIDYASVQKAGCGGVAEVELDICAWLEGCYDTNAGNMSNTLESLSLLTNGQPYNQSPWNYSGSEILTGTGITDWVMVSFRTGTDKESEVGRLAGLLQQDGCINFQNESGLPGGFSTPVYIVLEQRNHLPAMTPQPITIVDNTLSYDFRNANSYITGSSYGQKQLPGGDWSLHAGDINQTDVGGYDVNGSDKAIWQATNGLFSEYFPADLNMDGDVNGADKSLWNGNNGVFSGVPK